MEQARIVINATHLGARLNGIGVYIASLLLEWSASPPPLAFEVYLHEAARAHLPERFPENFRIHWVRSFHDTDNLRRFLYASRLGLRHRHEVLFEASQLEASFVGRRRIVTVHDLIPLQFPDRALANQARLYRWGLPYSLRQARAIVVPSNSTRDALVARYGLPQDKLHVIPHGIRPLPAAAVSPAEPPYLLFAGRITKYRNIDRLLGAFVQIQDRIPHRLVVVGEVAVRPRQFAVPDRVDIRGHVTDAELAALYRGASAFVFPSLGEGFGFTPLEAMSAGCPVVVSHGASLPEVCSGCAVLVDPEDEASIARGILEALDEGARAPMTERGKVHAAGFSWARSADAHARLFLAVD